MYPTPNQYRLLHRLRVRWAEVDMQSIVFNAHYLAYLDVAITEYWRAAAMPFAQTMARLQGDMVVRKATVDFHRSARMDDWLDVGMRFVKAGRTSLVFEGAVFRGDELLATGELLYVFTTPRVPRLRSQCLPHFWPRWRPLKTTSPPPMCTPVPGPASRLGPWPCARPCLAMSKACRTSCSTMRPTPTRTTCCWPTTWGCRWPAGGWCATARSAT